MRDAQFEWDDAKATQNLRKHGVPFEAAREAFRDAFAIEWEDDRQGVTEARFALLGMVDGRLLYVGFTMRGERIRIISARGAEPLERRRYHDEDREA